LYLSTERLKELFAGVPGVFRVNDRYRCLRGEDIRDLLEACGAQRYLQPIPVKASLSANEKMELRRAEGLLRFTWEHSISDVTLRGLEPLLSFIGKLEASEQRKRTTLLWQALNDVEDRLGADVFFGEYTWGYSHERKTATFDANFVRLLNKTDWIPTSEGLRRPEFVLFSSLSWRSNPFLESKIHFKAPIIDQLAAEVGIEPGILELLKKIGVTSEAELRKRLGVKAEGAEIKPDSADTLEKIDTKSPEPTKSTFDSVEGSNSSVESSENEDVASGANHGANSLSSKQSKGQSQIVEKQRSANTSTQFVSYVAVHPDEKQPDPDGLDHASRMALEQKAIEFILSCEPNWSRTPTHNPGFDLYQGDGLDKATKWCEVKAMTAGLSDRPVGLSHTQFGCAKMRGSAYWLYVVERANTDNPRLIRIQDPAGKAKTYTFDYGWLEVASMTDAHKDDLGGTDGAEYSKDFSS
jgi:hypothetical protein